MIPGSVLRRKIAKTKKKATLEAFAALATGTMNTCFISFDPADLCHVGAESDLSPHFSSHLDLDSIDIRQVRFLLGRFAKAVVAFYFIFFWPFSVQDRNTY